MAEESYIIKPALPSGTIHRSSTLQQGHVLHSRYQTEGIIGVGGMGAVYKAKDLLAEAGSNDICAIKELLSGISDYRHSLEKLNTFKREASVLSNLRHPSIPKIFDVFIESSRAYIVLEYIEGQDLEHYLESLGGEPAPESQVVEWALQICEVLEYLHTQSPKPIIFRDLKPSNIMLSTMGRIILVDFGLAKVFEEEKKGTVIGTEGYAPPEQYKGSTEPRSDIYALGATLHHLLTKSDPRQEPPFTFGQRSPSSLNPKISPAMEKIIMKCLEYDIEKRWANISELKEVIQRLNRTQPVISSGQFRKPLVAHITDDVIEEIANVTSEETSEQQDLEESENSSPVFAPVTSWVVSTGDEVRSSPVLGENTLYIGSYDTNLYAIDYESGNIKWKFATQGGICATPAVKSGFVYIGSEDSAIYVIHMDSGEMLWVHRTGGPVRSSCVFHDEKVFSGSDDGAFYAFSCSSGEEIWRHEIGRPVRSSACVYDDTVFVGADDGKMYALDVSDGKEIWSITTSQKIISKPKIVGNNLIFGSNNGILYCCDAVTGALQWKYEAGGAIIVTPSSFENKLFFGSTNQTFYCVNTAGELIWQVELPGAVSSSPAIQGTTAIFGTTDGNIYGLDIHTGGISWQVFCGKPILSSPLVTDTHVFIGSTDNNIYSIQTCDTDLTV